MNLPEAVQPKKSNKTIWIIIVAVALVLLCCILAIVLGVLFFNLRGNNALQSPLSGGVPSPVVTEAPTAISEPLEIDPANPDSSSYPTLEDLVPNWEAAATPSSQTWSVSVSRNQPVMVFMGWCTTTPEILAFNLKHIAYTLVVDDQPVNITGLYKWDSQESDRVCQTFVGLIRQWTGTSHTVVTTMTMDWALNDGWDDYLAGDYTDVYKITVSP